MDDPDGFAGPRVLPAVENLAGLQVEVDQDLARDAALTVAASGVHMALAEAGVDSDDIEDLPILLARRSAVYLAFPNPVACDPAFGGDAGHLGGPDEGLFPFASRGRTQQVVGR